MTDSITDAVRRLKELQEDVERLKAGQDEDGEPRLLFTAQERATVNDVITLTNQNEAQADVAAVTNSIDIIDNNEVQADVATADDTVRIGPDETQADTATATDQQADLRQQRVVGNNVNNGQFVTSSYNTTTYNAAITRPEISGYDLSQPGTLVSLRDTSDAVSYGFVIEATTPATFVVERIGQAIDPIRAATFTDTTTVNGGFEAPEATTIRIRNITTPSGTADAILGSHE